MTGNVLITGIAGLIGSHFSRYLLDGEYNVIGIDNLSGGYKDFIDDRVIFYEMDLINSITHLNLDLFINSKHYLYRLFKYEGPEFVYEHFKI